MPSTSNSPPSTSRFRYLPPSVATRFAITRLAWASRALILSSTACALSGFSSLTSTSTRGRPRDERRERVDLVDQVGGEDQRRQRVARLDLLDGLLAAPRPRCTRPARRSGRSTPIEGSSPVADRDPGVGRDFVEEGDPRLLRVRGDREADQDRDQHRVGDQQHRLQRRAAQDLQVLEQKPAHRSVPPVVEEGDEGGLEVAGRPPPGPRCGPPRAARSGEPSKRLSPSARTSSRRP